MERALRPLRLRLRGVLRVAAIAAGIVQLAGPEYLSNGDSHMYNSDRPLGTSSRGLPSYGLTEPICNLTPHHRRRSDNADD